LRTIERNDDGTISEVPDGIIFPILASLSEFAVKTKTGWRIDPASNFDDAELIPVAKGVYIERPDSNPTVMGRSKACYTALQQITAIYRKLLVHRSS
jgi:hypothetical protein